MPAHDSKKKINVTEDVPSIKCSCGFEILLVHNVHVVNAAIERHIEIHMQKMENPDSEAEAERLRVYLITQAFAEASKE